MLAQFTILLGPRVVAFVLMPKAAKTKKGSNSPGSLQPMLATLWKAPFDNTDWLFEVKWDGYRIVASIHNREVTLRSRSLLNYTSNYKRVADALASLKHDVVLDGEIVVLDEHGSPSFDRLQAYDPSHDTIIYYVFDILWVDGISLLNEALTTRKERLLPIIKELNTDVVRFSDHFESGTALFEEMKKLGMEGIVAKKKESKYSPGKRSKDWLKIPTSIREEFVIGGWAESDVARSFSSLLFGYYDNGKLHYQGHAGGGFKEKDMPQLLSRLKKLEINKKPFVNEVATDRKVHWVKPELVAEVKYATKTKSGKIRKPAIFIGLRPDKKPKEVVKTQSKQELPGTNGQFNNSEKKLQPLSEDSNWKLIERQRITGRGEAEIDGHSVELTNVDKELWHGVTKADLIKYYHSVSNYILPYLQHRPLSLHIKPHGPMKSGFYIKDMEGRQPLYADVFSIKRKHKKKGKRDVIDYIVCNNVPTLIYLVNLGCIDINPWSSRIHSAHEADFISIDLDPSDGDFTKAIEAARATKQVLDKYRLVALPKTSGKTGIHIFIPCAEFSFSNARTIAERLCHEIHELVPEITTTNVSINARGDKLFLDPSQNDFADTLASAYSVRPHYLPTVSAPLSWKEVNSKLAPHQFTINTIVSRIKKKGDLFKDLLSRKLIASNVRSLKKLASSFLKENGKTNYKQ